MASYTGIPSNSPTKYLGPNVSLVSIVTRNRSPTSADIRQGTTGQYYPIGSSWIVSKNPTTGAEGDIWYLSKIVANVAYWLQLVGGGLDIIHTPDGTNVQPVAGIINFLNGSGMSITGSSNNITFNSAGGGLTWSNVTSGPQTLAAGFAYSANSGSAIAFSLPATAAFGDFYIISGFGSGGWTLAQNSGQSIITGKATTTTGVGGSIASKNRYDTIQIVCVTANTVFKAVDWDGNILVT